MPRLTPRLSRAFARLAAVLAGLGYVATAAIPVTASPSFDRWEQLRAKDLRVARVAYQLSVGAAQLCPDALAPQAGFVVHSLDQYEPADRQAAARSYRLGPNVGVMAVVAGSPAQRSGLAADDQLVSVNGRALSVGEAAAHAGPTRATLAFAQTILAEEMAKGEVVLGISRAEGFQAVRFTAEIGCASDVELVPGDEVNAWADGQRVVVSDGILAHCISDDHLALVIAHELAHNLLHHGKRSVVPGSGNRKHLTERELAETRDTEEEADRLGVRLASAAAFDLSDAPSFVGALLSRDGPGGTAGTHPEVSLRLAVLRAEIAAVE